MIRKAIGIGALVAAAIGPASAQDAQPTPESDDQLRPANNPGEWITSTDYPTSAIVQGAEGSVTFEVQIAADGGVASCAVNGGSATQQLKDLTCKLVSERARFTLPQSSESGSWTGTVMWQIPESTPQPLPEPTVWSYSFVVDTDGSVISCETVGEDPYAPMPMCSWLENARFEPATDANGEPVRKRVTFKGELEVVDAE